MTGGTTTVVVGLTTELGIKEKSLDLLISSQDWSKDHSQLALVLGGRVSRLPSDISVGYRHAQLLILPSVDHRAPKSAICSILCLCFDLGHMPFVGSSRHSFCTSPSCTENLSVGFLFLWLPDGFGQGDTPFQEIRGKRVKSDYAQVWLSSCSHLWLALSPDQGSLLLSRWPTMSD